MNPEGGEFRIIKPRTSTENENQNHNHDPNFWDSVEDSLRSDRIFDDEPAPDAFGATPAELDAIAFDNFINQPTLELGESMLVGQELTRKLEQLFASYDNDAEHAEHNSIVLDRTIRPDVFEDHIMLDGYKSVEILLEKPNVAEPKNETRVKIIAQLSKPDFSGKIIRHVFNWQVVEDVNGELDFQQEPTVSLASGFDAKASNENSRRITANETPVLRTFIDAARDLIANKAT